MSEWMGRGTQSTPCVCGVSSAIGVCGRVGLGAGERREATSVDSVGGGCGGQAPSTAPHQRACHHSAPLCPVPPPTHTQRTGRGSAHSGGGWWEWRTVVVAATPHTATTTTCLTRPVCVMGVDSTSTASECTKWSHCPQHPRCQHHQQQEQEEEEEELVGGVGQKEWGWELVGGWGHTQARAWAHTSHQSVSGVVLSHGCVCGKRSALIHTTTSSSSRRTRVDKDRKDKDWWDKKKEGVAPTPPHTTNKPESTMVVSQTTTPTQNHNKKRKRKGQKGRWKQEEEREGQQAQGTVSVLVGCGTHVAQTTHHIHSTHRERDRKRKGTREKTEEDKGQGVVYGCGGDGKAGGKQVGDTPPLCPTFLPNPFFLPSPLFYPFPFSPFQNSQHNGLSQLFLQKTLFYKLNYN